jgi:hypothetical protein
MQLFMKVKLLHSVLIIKILGRCVVVLDDGVCVSLMVVDSLLCLLNENQKFDRLEMH